MTRNEDKIRKAAILIDSLDAPFAESLLQEMPADDARRVRDALSKLGVVEPMERDRVIEEFMLAGFPAEDEAQAEEEASENSGVEVDESLAKILAAGNLSLEEPEEPPAQPPRFAVLKNASAAELAQFFSLQPPPLVANALTQLPVGRAAEIVRQLAPAAQSEVLSCIAKADEGDRIDVNELELRVEQAFAEFRQSLSRPAGLAAVEAILESVDCDARQSMIQQLAGRDANLIHRLGYPAASDAGESLVDDHRPWSTETKAELGHTGPVMPRRAAAAVPDRTKTVGTSTGDRPAPERSLAPSNAPPQRQLNFQDLVGLDDAAIVQVLAAADPQVVLLALAGASHDFITKLFRRLPARQAKMLRKRLEQIGPLRLSDMDAAQRHLAALATRLANQGTIAFPANRRFSMAV